MAFQTEFSFDLPKGFVDEEGNLHKKGRMRLATAADEILPMRDPRVQQNPSYLTIIMLARVITKLGDLPGIDTKTIESLFTTDLAFLQNFYQRINELENPNLKTQCPKCDHSFEVPLDFLELSREA
ncbi:phage tail assembly protein [Bacillus horti]|uniref:Phage FluMu protein gp41 n=1 Tax=Caldalkalibacillus horti TaxID=77523 RepID=A0ABT9W001_9BACI|nr:phage tail assembly protein [Bacillus horti]MDQ0166559.1 phage FluMu protein gp41 [Bacillus horti]